MIWLILGFSFITDTRISYTVYLSICGFMCNSLFFDWFVCMQMFIYFLNWFCFLSFFFSFNFVKDFFFHSCVYVVSTGTLLFLSFFFPFNFWKLILYFYFHNSVCMLPLLEHYCSCHLLANVTVNFSSICLKKFFPSTSW